MSWSRVYLGVHYPSDCFAGALVGLVCCAIGEAIAVVVRNTCLPCYTFQCVTHTGARSDNTEGAGSGWNVGGMPASMNRRCA